MHREELMKQLYDLLENGAEIEKVKITYKNGAAVKIDFDDDDDKDDDEEDEEEVVVENNDVIQETGWKVSIINR